ncbi:circadian-associated transcriptional repressor [Hippoglossus hippoglossus]|uniref:circadian-associated transcriptional repressor n=1 Tax=Hippoglossus hippoglossus TaxID=8267 RepID=UPI00148C777E|nr:circadian-associated transcriptional repressor [Hippoglossus hippoglossus]XP_034444267.1 circadian-associated transcriptional repressor [Hippoglossus hippoglossus]XP_035013161.1 circadian-associated transcriptional repressor [Hippoglossus stenolepis]XP_035013162.1 circadian-associated transcriptional repressor [Hippoglossus stenolepis]
MSATDSDTSIDWLASDTEDNESEREFDCSRELSQTEAPPSPSSPTHLGPSDASCRQSSEMKGEESDWSEVREASSRGSSPGRTETYDIAIGLCKTHQGEKANGRNAQQALKRPRSSAEEECEERQLISNMSERDRIFSSKCMELQCYIHPLSLILNGLRSGRYRERLSSFQESVAMDRIQRIMGVLQNPCMGEKYINIILKMEEMLKSWFPNVKLQDQLAVTQTEKAAPTKKLKLSPVNATAAESPVPVSDPPVGAKALRVTDLTPGGAYSANNLKWLHTSPICSPTAEQAQAGPRHLLPPRDRDLTQVNAVSSSTDAHTKTDSVPRGLPPGKINAPCLERLLKSTESIITRRETRGLMDSSWS